MKTFRPMCTTSLGLGSGMRRVSTVRLANRMKVRVSDGHVRAQQGAVTDRHLQRRADGASADPHRAADVDHGATPERAQDHGVVHTERRAGRPGCEHDAAAETEHGVLCEVHERSAVEAPPLSDLDAPGKELVTNGRMNHPPAEPRKHLCHAGQPTAAMLGVQTRGCEAVEVCRAGLTLQADARMARAVVPGERIASRGPRPCSGAACRSRQARMSRVRMVAGGSRGPGRLPGGRNRRYRSGRAPPPLGCWRLRLSARSQPLWRSPAFSV